MAERETLFHPGHRYALFTGEHYYPLGGWDDFAGSFETLEAATEAGLASKRSYSWWQIADLQTGERVMDDYEHRQHTHLIPDTSREAQTL